MWKFLREGGLRLFQELRLFQSLEYAKGKSQWSQSLYEIAYEFSFFCDKYHKYYLCNRTQFRSFKNLVKSKKFKNPVDLCDFKKTFSSLWDFHLSVCEDWSPGY